MSSYCVVKPVHSKSNGDKLLNASQASPTFSHRVFFLIIASLFLSLSPANHFSMQILTGSFVPDHVSFSHEKRKCYLLSLVLLLFHRTFFLCAFSCFACIYLFTTFSIHFQRQRIFLNRFWYQNWSYSSKFFPLLILLEVLFTSDFQK